MKRRINHSFKVLKINHLKFKIMSNKTELKANLKKEKIRLHKQVGSLKKIISDYKVERKSNWKEFKKKFKIDVEKIEQNSKAIVKQFKIRDLRKSTYTYNISGMVCAGCAETIQHILTALPGVIYAKVNLGKKQVEITSSQLIKIDALQNSLNNTNYTISERRA
jgi:copper chaperone CopZ